MREAKYARARAAAAGQAPAAPAKAAPAKPAKKAAQPAPVAPPLDGGADAEALCGHKNISGRTCTREKGHAAKSHRYS